MISPQEWAQSSLMRVVVSTFHGFVGRSQSRMWLLQLFGDQHADLLGSFRTSDAHASELRSLHEPCHSDSSKGLPIKLSRWLHN